MFFEEIPYLAISDWAFYGSMAQVYNKWCFYLDKIWYLAGAFIWTKYGISQYPIAHFMKSCGTLIREKAFIKRNTVSFKHV